MSAMSDSGPPYDPSPRVKQLYARAKAAILLKEYVEAVCLLDEALVERPVYQLHRLRAVASASCGDHAAALEDGQLLKLLQPHLLDGWRITAFAHYNLGHYDAAALAFNEALSLCPDDDLLRQGFWNARAMVLKAMDDRSGSCGIATGS